MGMKARGQGGVTILGAERHAVPTLVTQFCKDEVLPAAADLIRQPPDMPSFGHAAGREIKNTPRPRKSDLRAEPDILRRDTEDRLCS